jgi:flagellar hook-associated protein 1 FlgK
MAVGTFGSILGTGQQALLAHQTALQVTGQNIANANTPGYSRERAELVSAPSSSTRIMRSGVHVEEITRAYDRFVTAQVAVASSHLKDTQTQSDLLGQVEALFHDLDTPETGLSGALDALFQSLHDLAQHPQGLSERSSVLQQGQNVAEAFHQLANGLQELSQGRNAELGDAITEVNHLTTQLASLNQQIREREVDPKNHANTLRDQQDLLLKQLAEKINITSLHTDAGQVTVLLGGGRPLVEGVQSFNLATRVDPDDPQRLLVDLNDAQGHGTDVTAQIQSGRIHGLLVGRDTVLPRLQASLDRLAAQLTTSLNQTHSTGYGLDGTTGQDFFVARPVSGQAVAANAGGGTLQSVSVFDPSQLTLDDYRLQFTSGGAQPTFDIVDATTGATVISGQNYTAGATFRFAGLAVTLADNGIPPQPGDTFLLRTTHKAAQNIAVAPTLLANPRQVAAAQSLNPGDNANVLTLAQLRDTLAIDGSTFGTFYHTLVTSVGAVSQQATRLAENQQTVLTDLENRREALAGVSLDEEQVNLIRFQQAYNAAANFIRIAGELGQTVLDLVR